MLSESEFDDLGIMSDEDIRTLAKRLNTKIKNITFAENIDMKKKMPFGANVINLGDDNIGGTHWTLFYVPSNERVNYYFDSFGGPPEDNLVQQTHMRGRTLVFNNKQIQGLNESHCGVWVVLMAKVLGDSSNYNRLSNFNKFIEREGIV